MNKLLTALFFLCLLWPLTAISQTQQPDTSAIRNIPIQHEGRLKSLDSFAQITMEKLSDQKHLGQMSALDWLTLTLFDPQNAALVDVIKIENDNIRHKLQLSNEKDLYNLQDLNAGIAKTQTDVVALLEKDQNALTLEERALIETHEKAATLINLMRSFSGILPLELSIPQKYAAEIFTPPRFIDLLELEGTLHADVKNIVTQRGADPSKFTEQEKVISQLGYQLQTLRMGGQTNRLLRVIPNTNDNIPDQWVSPWTTILQSPQSPDTTFILSLWADLAQSYRDQNHEQWDSIAKDIATETNLQAEAPTPISRFNAERIYRNAMPYLWVTLLYAAVILLAVLKSRISRTSLTHKLPTILMSTAVALHTVSIAARIYILDRPPVGTLYESVLFVALICAVAGLWMYLKKNNIIALGAGAVGALALLLSAPVFAPNGDSLEVLVAVLNTSFWLTTHVLIITAGYGFCILTGILAHIALAAKSIELRMVLQKNVYALSLIALLLTAVGTVLGGIWADQSWGRFWGWDPKENGALLIVLWLIWAQHGRIANRFSPPMFLVLMALLNVIVAVSWFGVNLLNVGLHSYGFTSGMAEGLMAFCTIECILIAALYWRRTQQSETA